MAARILASQSKTLAPNYGLSLESSASLIAPGGASSPCLRALRYLASSPFPPAAHRPAKSSGTASPHSSTFSPSKGTLLQHWLITEHKYVNPRQYSVFNEFSKQLKGEAKSNPDFQRSIKDLNEKLGVVKEDLKARTKKTTEKLHKNVDDVWIEAEVTSKKVAANVKEKLTAAKEEVKETLGLGKPETSGSSYTTTTVDSSNAKDDDNAEASSESSGGTGNSEEQVVETDTLFSRFRWTLSSASPKVSLAFQKLKETKIHDIAKKGYGIIQDELSSSSSKRKRMQYTSTSTPSVARSTRTDIVIVPSKQSRLGKKWDAFKKKVQSHPIYKRMRGLSDPVVAKGQEIAEDVRETLETSDHPLVHKIIDLNEAVFGENATALSFKEIRRRDPTFSLPDFVQEVQEMIRPLLTAYYKGDIETLKKACSPEVIERCKGERMAYESQGIYFDNKILHISEVDVRETKMMGSTPIIVLAFQTQQIYCVRDTQGSITSGGQNFARVVPDVAYSDHLRCLCIIEAKWIQSKLFIMHGQCNWWTRKSLEKGHTILCGGYEKCNNLASKLLSRSNYLDISYIGYIFSFFFSDRGDFGATPELNLYTFLICIEFHACIHCLL